jgi:DNA-directed RNA polymerase specialized sigma24 family protein
MRIYTMTEKALNQRKLTIKVAQAASVIINTLPQTTINDIIKLRLEGYSYWKIGYILKIHSTTARSHCLKRGIRK